MQKFRRVFEGIAKAGQSTDLNDFYTELFITEGVSGEVNKEHEVSLIETASRKPAKEETPIKLEDIFKPLPGQDQPSRTIMTTGVAGIGKTILTHKFTLDWAEGKANHDIHFTLPFTFRELNLLKEKEFSLMELLHHFFIQTKGIRRYDRFQVVFILDGLDECRLPLDFQNNPIWTDVTKSTSVDILLTNLIRGDLLPSARIWITTRPAAANQIPAECVDMVTEVRGFTDPQKEEYFRKRFREEPLASKIISHIKTSRSIHIMFECQHNIKSHLMQKFRRVFEGIAKAGQSTDLNDFYTELFITERVSGEVNKEHEVRLIETASRKPAKEETPIKLEDIFKPLPGQDQPSRTIMTTGVAGIGKTILTHKFTLDWAEGKANHDIHFTLPFTFRELNLLKEKEFSLVELLHHFFIQTKGIRRYDLFQVVFILDGLDECRLPLDFQNNPIWTDVTKSTSVDVLLTNLIRGDLLPSARIWITTRPAAANQIPAECVGMVTEVRGFTDPQKDEYFRKRFKEETLASTIISHIKTSRSLHIMCHIPCHGENRTGTGGGLPGLPSAAGAAVIFGGCGRQRSQPDMG
ncbi:hypothetical protein NHX12_015675 [Muraenolepis orangiensis]|uniref:NACHT domain-containing protein n=2 Tax=Muraenolepis orangiensis TaxID=630683 RepID=A0A9Q0D5K0_9TELE|nr:hypothetical protein NHX12_015675 [Muraenolepis orangiensis]